MNEKVKVGIVVAAIAAVSIGGMLGDTWRRSPKPIPGPQSPKVTIIKPAEIAQYPNTSEHNQAPPDSGVPTRSQVASPETQSDTGCFPNEKSSECDARKIQRKIATFSLYLVGVGAAQVIVGVLVLLIYRRMHGIMERQSDISDQMRTGAFWPHLVIEEPRFKTLFPTRDTDDRRPTATYMLKHVGEKTVILKSLHQQIVFDTGMPRKIDRDAPWRVTYRPMHEGDFSVETADFLEEITDEVDREMRGLGHRVTRKRFFLIVEAVCEDVFGQQHEFGWCFHGSRQGGAGLPYGGTTYNYRCIRKPEKRV